MKKKLFSKTICCILTAIIAIQCPASVLAQKEKPLSFLDLFSNDIDDALEWVENAADDVQGWTENVINDAQNWIQNAAGDVLVWTQGASTDVQEWTEGAAADAWAWTQTAVSDAQDWTTDAAGNAWNWTTGAADDAWTWTQNTAGDVADWTCTTATTAWNVTTESISGTWTDIFGESTGSGPYNICVSSPLFKNTDLIGTWNNEADVYTECFNYDDSYDISLTVSNRPDDVLPPSVGEMDYADFVAAQFDTVTFATDAAEGAGVRAMAQELRFKAVRDGLPVYGRALGVWTDHYISSFIITANILLDDDGTEISDLPEIDSYYNLWSDTLSIYETNKFEIDFAESTENNINPGSLTAGGVRSANRIFDEVRFHSPKGGHGFAAEQANTLYDNIKGIFSGQRAKIIGDNNAANGADRELTLRGKTNPYQIQTKYHSNARSSINACFDENGQFRYLTSDGSPMKIEVPSDQYDDALLRMKEHIINGDVPGVTDPEQANDIVRKGNVSYQQAKNIAKAGTIDSIKYDAINGCVDCAFSFGISAAVEFAIGMWNGEDFETALKQSVFTGLQVGGTSFVISVLAGQLSKTGLNSLLVGGSEKLVKLMGSKAAATFVNAFRKGGNIWGAAAQKAAAKMLRGNIIVASVSLVVLSVPDIVDTCRGRISGKQLLKNVAKTGGGITGGLGGWFGGAALGTLILPGVGTIIGGIIGSVAGGYVMQITTGAVADLIAEDDADGMLDIVSEELKQLSGDYLLNEENIEEVVTVLGTDITGDMLKDMFACSTRELYAREIILRPVIRQVLADREIIDIPSGEQYQESMILVLEDIYDEEQSEGGVVVE